MRVGIASPPLVPTPPSGYGGIERLTYYLALGLEQLGHEVVLFAAPGSHRPKSGELITATTEYHIGELATKALRSERIDVLADWTHAKSPSWRSLAEGVARRAISMVFYTDALGPTINVFPSFAVRRQMDASDSAPVIPPGIDVVSLMQHARREKEDYFVFFSRIIPEKGVERAISVARRAHVKLYVAGHTGEFAYDKQYVEKIKSMCDGEQIIWVGDVDEKQKIELLSHARGLIYWSKWLESFGIFIVEALALGTPCVVNSDSGGPAEMVINGHTGFVCSTIHDFVEAVRLLKVDDSFIKPDKCIERAMFYHYTRMAAQWDELMREVVERA